MPSYNNLTDFFCVNVPFRHKFCVLTYRYHQYLHKDPHASAFIFKAGSESVFRIRIVFQRFRIQLFL
jgi:hypothetical protein